MLAGQHLRAEAQGDEIVAQRPLLGFAPRSPFLDAGDTMTRHGKGPVLVAGCTVKTSRCFNSSLMTIYLILLA